jgi:ubiquinone/menaquinone biosynthesis C-methylase UbiE
VSEPPLIMSTQAGYDRWAEIYDTEQNPLISLEEPVVDRLLGDVAGLDVVDVGCGTGRHTLRLAGRGARVVGVDFSDGMLARARDKEGAAHVEWVAHDLTDLPLPFEDRSFDRVVCALVVDHIADLDGFFGELARLCRAGGRVVVTVMHPAMMLKGTQARFVDPDTGRETRPASHTNLISDYVNAAVSAGVGIVEVGESSVDEELAERVPRAHKYLGWPTLFWLELVPGAR